MTKLNLKDATKELAQNTATILTEASAARKSAEDLVARLRAIEKGFERQNEEAEAARRREEQLKARSTQSRAYRRAPRCCRP